MNIQNPGIAMVSNPRHHHYRPQTPRGRALHTIDWFLNGRPRLHNHDDQRLTVHHCNAG